MQNKVYISVMLIKSNYIIIGIKRAYSYMFRDSRL
jgi:hypothetical protein